jgi:hypothetical protein
MADLDDLKSVLDDILYELKQINRKLEPLSELSELESIRKVGQTHLKKIRL